ncbi:MAG: hypothetical protein EPN38_09290 [Rhodanobacteraceae bacterium]|nr:MAG: hypothetical protein EPN38_09290 [Rhodanobacteraceae bacterium]
MAIRPNNLTPNRGGDVQAPEVSDKPRRYSNLINQPYAPQFGGAVAVARSVKKAPYGRVAHVGKRGNP